MCPGHPNIHHDSAKCPTTGSSKGPAPPRARDLPPAGGSARDLSNLSKPESWAGISKSWAGMSNLTKQERRSGGDACDASWCNCESVDAGAGAGLESLP